MTTHSPVAQVEVEDEIAKLKTKIEVLEATIKEYENEYKQATREERKDLLGQMIIAKEVRLHDLNEELKIFRQQGKEQRTHPFIFMVLSFPIDSLVVSIDNFLPVVFIFCQFLVTL